MLAKLRPLSSMGWAFFWNKVIITVGLLQSPLSVLVEQYLSQSLCVPSQLTGHTQTQCWEGDTRITSSVHLEQDICLQEWIKRNVLGKN